MDFDQGRKRRQDTSGFTLGGERFAVVDMHPDDVNAYMGTPVPDTQAETQEQIDAFVLSSLSEVDQERWKALRARKEDPVTYGDLLGLSRWLLEHHAERPTTQPSPSSGGRQRTQDGSEGSSHSGVVTLAT